MSNLPKDKSLESSVALKREGYTFVSNRCERLGTDRFMARIMLRPTVCAQGADAAEMFYGGDRFTRVGAMPNSVARLLQDDESVGTLDAEHHHHRKSMFTQIMGPEPTARLIELLDAKWDEHAAGWKGTMVLTPALRMLLADAACEWAGVPQKGVDLKARCTEFGAMLDNTGSVGPANWHAQRIRLATEAWAEKAVVDYRASDLMDDPAAPSHALKIIAEHREPDGSLIVPSAAAVEIINIGRPIMSVDRYCIYAAIMLYRHPEWRQRLADEPGMLRPFAQEVRRIAPFFPVIAGKARFEFEWGGHTYREGDVVMLDLYGTNLDPDAFEGPHDFRPERFVDRELGPWEFVPSGGGDPAVTHRCPGEEATIAIIMKAVERLADMEYTVPEQDLEIDLRSVPAHPASGFIVELN